ncbi:MAG: DsbA family oxidoreductase [Myxococcota bacterium]
MKVDVWSDVVCPWCAIGRSRLQTAIAAFGAAHGEPVEVRWRSFELDPGAARIVEGDHVAHLARKYGRTRAQAQEMVDQMAARGAAEGVMFDFGRLKQGNTFDAHRLLHLAQEHGMQDALKARMFRAYFQEGEAIGDRSVLARLAADVGLEAADVARVLEGDAYAGAVRGDETLARQLGISGVPFFVIDERLAVSGAQPAELLTQALAHALETRSSEDVPESAGDGEVCGPDGCAV